MAFSSTVLTIYVVQFVVLLSIVMPRNAATPKKKKKKVSASTDSSILIFNKTYSVPVFLFLKANSLRISSILIVNFSPAGWDCVPSWRP